MKKHLWTLALVLGFAAAAPAFASGFNRVASEFDGRTGASVTRGPTLTTTVQIPNELIDADLQIVIDSAVEDKREIRNDVTVPLTQANSGKAVSGRGYIKAFSFTL
ncbi:DUF2271 domain-containing protein [Reinekea sp.]|uniref:DUF2271 domain-containing protein n=1 Tax=Reinekea sp. TaxID=1970455 RepID=UPI002A830822|nr:DUF2271 domain-containing protein [Reinekea sp.]